MTDLDAETVRVLRAYLDAAALADPLQRELARKYDVALGDLHALRSLRDLGTVPIGRLIGVLDIKASNATYLVDRLERKGLVERCDDPSDRRVTLLRLTDRASEAMHDFALVESSGLVARIQRLTPGERLQLAALLEQIVAHRRDEAADDADAVPGRGDRRRNTAVLPAGRPFAIS